MSETDNCDCAGNENLQYGKERPKRKALRRPRITDIEGVDVTCWDRLFQVRAAATVKVWSVTVDNRVRRTLSNSEDADRRRLLALSKIFLKRYYRVLYALQLTT